MADNDDLLDKGIEGPVPFASCRNEVCACPGRTNRQSTGRRFIERAFKRVAAITQGSPPGTPVQ